MSLNILNLESFYVGSEPVSKIYAGSDLVWQPAPTPTPTVTEYIPNPAITTFPAYESLTTESGRYLEIGTKTITASNAPVIKNLDFSKEHIFVLWFKSTNVPTLNNVPLLVCDGWHVFTKTQMMNIKVNVNQAVPVPQIYTPYGSGLSTVNTGNYYYGIGPGKLQQHVVAIFGYNRAVGYMGMCLDNADGSGDGMLTCCYENITSLLTGAITVGHSSTVASSSTSGLTLDLSKSGYYSGIMHSSARFDPTKPEQMIMIPKT